MVTRSHEAWTLGGAMLVATGCAQVAGLGDKRVEVVAGLEAGAEVAPGVVDAGPALDASIPSPSIDASNQASGDSEASPRCPPLDPATGPHRLVTADAFVAGGSGLYGVNPDDGQVYRYDSPGWTALGPASKEIVANDDTVFTFTADGASVLEFTGTPGTWTDTNALPLIHLIAGGTSLFGIAAEAPGKVWQFQAVGGTWAEVGAEGKQFVANEAGLFGLAPDGSQTWQYPGQPPWAQVSSKPLAELFAGGTTLLAVEPATGSLLWWKGTLDQWLNFGGNWQAAVIAQTNVIYALADDQSEVVRIEGDGAQAKIGGVAERIYAAGPLLFAFRSGDLEAYDASTDAWTNTCFGLSLR